MKIGDISFELIRIVMRKITLFGNFLNQPESDFIHHLPIDSEPNIIQFGSKSISIS